MSKKCLTRCVGFAPCNQLAGKMSWRRLASEWSGGQMSRRRSSASGTSCRICLLPLPAIRGPGDALGLDTISGLVAAVVPVSFSGPGAALGSMPYLIPSPVMVMRLYLCASPFQVRPSSLLLSLVLVRPLCLLQSAVMVWPQDVLLPSLVVVRPLRLCLCSW